MGSNSGSDFCHVYGLVREQHGGSSKEFTLCARDEREKIVYTSRGNQVEVQLVTDTFDRDRGANFLLRYEGEVWSDLH